MIELSGNGVEWLAVGGLLTLVGVLIKFRGWTFLIAGYDETTSVSEDVVQNLAGNAVLRVGLAVVVVGILEAVANPPSYVGVLVGAVIVLDMLRLVYRVNTASPQAS